MHDLLTQNSLESKARENVGVTIIMHLNKTTPKHGKAILVALKQCPQGTYMYRYYVIVVKVK